MPVRSVLLVRRPPTSRYDGRQELMSDVCVGVVVVDVGTDHLGTMS